MEWMLQVADELDDAVGAVRHHFLGLGAEIGTTLAIAAGTAAILAAALYGASALLIATALGLLGAASLMKMQGLLRA